MKMSSFPNLPSTSTASGSGHSSNSQQNPLTLKIFTVLENFQPSSLQTAAYPSVWLPYDIWTVPAGSVQNPNGPMSRQYNATFNNNHQQHFKEEASSSSFITCFRCKERAPTTRCLECNYSSCHECCLQLVSDCQLRGHTLLPIHQTAPIGASRNSVNKEKEVMLCNIHGDQFRYYCELCLVFICQECTLVLHKYHNITPINDTLDICRTEVLRALDDTKTGINSIETAIDRTVAMSKACEKDTKEVSIEIKKAMRCHTQAIEDREKYLLEQAEKMCRDKMNDYTGHMITLRGMLAGLTHTHETLARSIDSKGIDLLKAKEKGSIQLDYYTCKLKNMSIKEERIVFVPPNYDLVDKMKTQCHVQLVPPSSLDSRSTSSIPSRQSMPPLQSAQSFQHHNHSISESSRLRPLPEHGSLIRPTYYYNQSIASSLALYSKASHGIGQAIPGYCMPVSVGPTGNPLPGFPLFSFGHEGQDKGQMSTPWGLCVDSQGNIIVSDRRNNRIQIFNRTGQFKTMFGYKGDGPGELNLPVGITTDSYGRIIVVDKDNHRVQIFTSSLKFLLNFGKFGTRCGQFQYPWDVAVNTLGNIVVTDTRNHRIQMFNSAGIFIKMFTFICGTDNKTLKGVTSPRGVCFLKTGNILVSDFENHRLIMLDPTLSKVLYWVGLEGSGVGELNRPSGIVTDDYGRIIVADSKNHRILVFTPELRIMGVVILNSPELDDTDEPCDVALKVRPHDVALTPEGHVVVSFETMRGTEPVNSRSKHYIKVFTL